MGWIEIEPEMAGGQVVKRPPPKSGARQQIFSARPFVAGEEHRAILDADAHVVILGQSDERAPRLEETRPVFVDAPRPVASSKRVDRAEPKLRCGSDDLPQVADRSPGDFGIRVELFGASLRNEDLDRAVGELRALAARCKIAMDEALALGTKFEAMKAEAERLAKRVDVVK